MSTRLADEF